MTHSLGKGTVNFPLNLTDEESAIIGRLAFKMDCSKGEYIRRMFRRGLAMSRPKDAIHLAEIRRHRKAAILLILFFAWLATPTHEPIRRVRVRTATRLVRVVRGNREEAA